MAHHQLAIGSHNPDWKQSCYPRIEILKEFGDLDAPVSELIKGTRIMESELYEACYNGHVDQFVGVLEKHTADKQLPFSSILGQVTNVGDTFLHMAAAYGRQEIVELMKDNFPEFLTIRNLYGDTALHLAARSKNANLVRIMLSRLDWGAGEVVTRLKNEYGNTPLHEAVASRDLPVIIELLTADQAAAHLLNKLDQSPLFISVLLGDIDISNLLLTVQLPSPLPHSSGNSPLHAAVFQRDSVVLKEIMKSRPEMIYFRDEDGGTPLHYAALIGYVDAVRLFLLSDARNALESNKKGALPIHVACKAGQLEVVKLMLQQQNINPRFVINMKGRNLLHIASKAGENTVLKFLLRSRMVDDATINGRDINGDTPIHLAAMNFCIENLYSLSRDKRVSLKIINNNGFTPRDVAMLMSNNPLTFQERLSDFILHSAGACLSEKVESSARFPKRDELTTDWAKERVNTYMVVSILLITITFAAAFTLPRGFNSSDDKHRGMAVLVKKILFQIFIVCNTVALYASVSVCIVLMLMQSDNYLSVQRGTYFAHKMLLLALHALGVGFGTAAQLAVNQVRWLGILIAITGGVCFLLMHFCYILNSIPTYSCESIMRQTSKFCLSELRLRVLMRYAQTSKEKIIPRKLLDAPNQQ